MPSSYERILQITVLNKIKDRDISKLTGDELDWLKTRPDIMETINEAARYNKLRDDPYYKDVISGTIEEILNKTSQVKEVKKWFNKKLI